ncbi:hypothetical protein ACTXMA_14580 [Corynebacterium variabile]|uniref:hypothetical protein n=1 Tax=Corynebacterium variabile TaxID=1727 RepID=UPI003FCF1D13
MATTSPSERPVKLAGPNSPLRQEGRTIVDFNTLKGIDVYREAFPTVFDGMSDADAKRVVWSVHSGVLSGWEPSAAEKAVCGLRTPFALAVVHWASRRSPTWSLR